MKLRLRVLLLFLCGMLVLTFVMPIYSRAESEQGVKGDTPVISGTEEKQEENIEIETSEDTLFHIATTDDTDTLFHIADTEGNTRSVGSDLSSTELRERIVSAMRSDMTNVDVSDLDIHFDLSNGEHILSDFQDELFFDYAEDSFVLQNLTFTQQDGKLLSVQLNYVDDVSVRAEQRSMLTARIDAIVAEASALTDENERADKIARLIADKWTMDWFYGYPHGMDAYGCLILGNASFGAEMAFQACLNRFGYDSTFVYQPYSRDVYVKTTTNDGVKYSHLGFVESYNDYGYIWADASFTSRYDESGFQKTYPDAPLTTSTYTPIALFSNNPYLNPKSANGRFFQQQVIAGNTAFTFPEPFCVHYKFTPYSEWKLYLEMEYPEIGMFTASRYPTFRLDGTTLSASGLNYTITDANERARILEEYYAARDALVERAREYPSDRSKIVFLSNYILNTTAYLNGRTHSHDAYGCLVEGYSVCEGSASALNDILRELGMETYFSRPTGHIYSQVLLDGHYYAVDLANLNNASSNLPYINILQPDNSAAPYFNSSVPRRLYALNDSLSMKSDATRYLISQIAQGKRHINMSQFDFWMDVDEQGNAVGIDWYVANLKHIYPIELLYADQITLNTDHGIINSVDVAYRDISNAEMTAFQSYVDSVIATASQKTTEKEKFNSVISALYQKSITDDGNTDIIVCALENRGTNETLAILGGYICEKMGIRYTLHGYSGNRFYLKTVINGTEWYGVLTSGRLYNTILFASGNASVWGYNYIYDFPVYELKDDGYSYQPRWSLSGPESQYLDIWGADYTLAVEPEPAPIINDLSYTPFQERLLNGIRNDAVTIDISDLNIYFDLSNGKHILSDFQDRFMFRYIEDTFVVKNMTFTHQDGKLLSVTINYMDSASERAEQRQQVSAGLDNVIAQLDGITDAKAQADAITTIMRRTFEEDRLMTSPHALDLYGCFIEKNASPYGYAAFFQACMTRLGYESDYYLDESRYDIYVKTLINGEWKYTGCSEAYAWKTTDYNLIDKTESTFTYSDEPLTSPTYTPMTIFVKNPYLDETNANSQYFRDQIIAGKTSFVLPNTVDINYRLKFFLYVSRIRHEYPEVDFLYKSADLSLVDGKIHVNNVQYQVTAQERQEMVAAYQAARDKIVQRANRLESDRAKIIFVNNYMSKTTTYRAKIAHCQEAYGCLVNHLCVCEGYGTAFHDIMNHLGIQDRLVMTNSHLSNRVYLEGQYWRVDVTNNGQNLHLLEKDEYGTQTRTYAPLMLYALNDTLSMKSDATKHLVKELARGNTHISMEQYDFWLDEVSKEKDTNWYMDVLLDTYPLETMNIDTITFQTVDGEIQFVDVTYKQRDAATLAALKSYINTISGEALTKTTEKAKFEYVVKAVYQFGITSDKTKTTDILDCYTNGEGAPMAIMRLCGSIFEKLGIRYSVMSRGGDRPYFKLVLDGQERYASPISGYTGYTNTNGWGYNEAADYPIYELFDEAYAYQPRHNPMALENAELDAWGEPMTDELQVYSVSVNSENQNGRVAVSWNTINAKGVRYFLQRKEANETAWKLIDILYGTSFVDFNVVSGHTYQYRVQVMPRYESPFFSNVSENTYLTVPRAGYQQTYSVREKVVKTVLSWNAVAGANSYDVYCEKNSQWQLLHSTSSTSVTLLPQGCDISMVNSAFVPANATGRYLVTAKKGNATSAVAPDLSISFIVPSSVTCQAVAGGTNYTMVDYPHVYNESKQTYQTGVKIKETQTQVKWSPVEGVVSYDVYRIRTTDNSMKFLGTVVGVVYRDRAIVGQSNYYVVVPRVRNLQIVPTLN